MNVITPRPRHNSNVYYLISKCPISGIVTKSKIQHKADKDVHVIAPHSYFYLNLNSLNRLVDNGCKVDIQAILLAYLQHAELLANPTKLHKLNFSTCITIWDKVIENCNHIANNEYLQRICPKFASNGNEKDCSEIVNYIGLVASIVTEYRNSHKEESISRSSYRNSNEFTRARLFANLEQELARELSNLAKIESNKMMLLTGEAKQKLNGSFEGFKMPSSLASAILATLAVASVELREYYYLMLTKPVKVLRRHSLHTFIEQDWIDLHTDISLNNNMSALTITSLLLTFIEKKQESFNQEVVKRFTKTSKGVSTKNFSFDAKDLLDLSAFLGIEDTSSDTSDEDLMFLTDEEIESRASGKKPKPSTKLTDLTGNLDLGNSTMGKNTQTTKNDAKAILARLLAKTKTTGVK